MQPEQVRALVGEARHWTAYSIPSERAV